jgi:hypothetical protein
MREPGQQVMSMVTKCNTILVMQSHAPAGPVLSVASKTQIFCWANMGFGPRRNKQTFFSWANMVFGPRRNKQTLKPKPSVRFRGQKLNY